MVLKFWDIEFLVTTTLFQNSSNITSTASNRKDISEKLDFWWSIPQQRDQYWSFWYQGWFKHQWSGRFFRWKRVFEAVEASKEAEVNLVVEVLRPEKNFLLNINKNIMLNLGNTFSVRGCWHQPMLLYWKMVVATKNSLSQDSRTIFKPNLNCIFLSVRANS